MAQSAGVQLHVNAVDRNAEENATDDQTLPLASDSTSNIEEDPTYRSWVLPPASPRVPTTPPPKPRGGKCQTMK